MANGSEKLASQHEISTLKTELLVPAGGFDSALAAFQYGADAIYMGLPRFSARADAENLTPQQASRILAYARSFVPAKKVYFTCNTLVQDSEWESLLDLLDVFDDLAPNGIIVQDLGVARLIRDYYPRLALHASTQMAAHNLEGVLALKHLGFSRVVLARECTCSEIEEIVRKSNVEIEIFIHGALCYSYSGLCLFSSLTSGRSGNRGRCAYCCRDLFDSASPDDPMQASFPFSMRDLALAPLLNEITKTGVTSLKIEGRMKRPLYVACVTDYYRKLLDGNNDKKRANQMASDLQTIFSRPWTTLYAQGTDARPESILEPIAIGHQGAPIGDVQCIVRDPDNRCWLRFRTTRALERHDGIQLALPTGGRAYGFAVTHQRLVGSRRDEITLPADSQVELLLPENEVPHIPLGTAIFCSASQAVRRRYAIQTPRESAYLTGHPVDFHVTLRRDGIQIVAQTTFHHTDDFTVTFFLPHPLDPARQPDQTLAAVERALRRMGDTDKWHAGEISLDDPDTCYAPLSKLNEARRSVLDQLDNTWQKQVAARREKICALWNLMRAEPATLPPALSQRAREIATTSRPLNWSLKLNVDAEPEGIQAIQADVFPNTLVLQIGHLNEPFVSQQLNRWKTHFPNVEHIRLALPLISRSPELSALKATVKQLIKQGGQHWECADLAGYQILKEFGITPESADWSLYALNRMACAELSRLGFQTQVYTPEGSFANLRDLFEARHTTVHTPDTELLVYQHTPLFLSATAPAVGGHEENVNEEKTVELRNRRKQLFFVRKIQDLWVTTSAHPYCLADRLPEATALGITHVRADFSWSPKAIDVSTTCQALLKGQCPDPSSEKANINRGLI